MPGTQLFNLIAQENVVKVVFELRSVIISTVRRQRQRNVNLRPSQVKSKARYVYFEHNKRRNVSPSERVSSCTEFNGVYGKIFFPLTQSAADGMESNEY